MTKLMPSDAKYRFTQTSQGLGFSKLIYAEVDDSFRFDCLRCGKCCSIVPDINPKDAARMANYLVMSKGDFFKNYVTLKEDDYCGWRAVLDKVGDSCTFYSKEAGKASCKVHIAKPWQCSARPVTVRDGDIEYLESLCVSINTCRGFERGPETTVRQWIKNKGMINSLKYEIDYTQKLASLKRQMNRNELREAITKLFTE
jgi:Fe-S-cluster containining protein